MPALKIEKEVSLKPFNTFGVDVKARRLVVVDSVSVLKEALRHQEIMADGFIVLGGGSNVLFTGDYNGTILLNRIGGIEQVGEDATHVWIKAGAGERWHDLVLWCVERNYGGIENLSLIPGSVGAAPIQNIGAYGAELKDVFHQLEAVLTEDQSIHIFNKEECRFSYRESIFKNEWKHRCIITSVTLRLNKFPEVNTSYGAIEQELTRVGITHPGIKDVSDAVIRIRKSKLPEPEVLGNAGSFFKNPEIEANHFEYIKKNYPAVSGYPQPSGRIKVSAGWLIEQCGFKGKQIGRTGTYKDQALVIVNYGGASGEEIARFARAVAQEVKRKFGIQLEEEVNII
jgi:UDP-N-acetylmuramate dehydrogenase